MCLKLKFDVDVHSFFHIPTLESNWKINKVEEGLLKYREKIINLCFCARINTCMLSFTNFSWNSIFRKGVWTH